MNRRIRQTLLILALIAFFVIAPAIVLYALGFRLQARVGVLVVESLPNRAEVIVDGQPRGTTPQTVTGLGGDVIQLMIKKTGYRSWEKRLPLVQGATEVRSIRLVPEAVAPNPLRSAVNRFTLAPNRQLLALIENETQLSILDEDGSPVVPVFRLPAPPAALLWSPDSTLILVTYPDGRHDIVKLTDDTLQTLPPVTLFSPDAIVWDPRLPGRLIMLSPGGTLLAYDSGSQTQRPLTDGVSAFAPSSGEIVLVTQTGSLQRITLTGQLKSTSAFRLPQPVQRLIVAPNGQVALRFENGSAALATRNGLITVANSVVSLGFSPSGHLLYLQTAPNELAVYNTGDISLAHVPLMRTQLVTRISEPITHPQWFAGGEHVIYQIGDRIVLTEIDTRDHAITEVIDSTNMSDAALAVGDEGESLFYLKRDPSGIISLVRTSLTAE